jgi:predicted nucleic acid-binding protein
MRFLLDTSALAKVYRDESGSAFVRGIVSPEANTILLSRLSVVEMRSALAGGLRAGEISEAELNLATQAFQNDIAARPYWVLAVGERHYAEAERLLGAFGSAGLRTLDALQLSVAVDLHRNGIIDAFVTSDRVLTRVAPQTGCHTIDPENPETPA